GLRVSGKHDMFGACSASVPEKLVLPAYQPWLASEKLLREYQVLRFYLTAQPLGTYRAVLDKLRAQNIHELHAAVKQGATAGRLAGTVPGKQERKTRTGNKMGIVTF